MPTHCQPNSAKQDILWTCIGKRGAAPAPDEQEWRWNVISTQVEVYTCGMVGRYGENLKHDHDSSEIERCQQLAQEAAETMAGQVMTDDEGTHRFHPFYIVANRDTSIEKITDQVIRSAFSNTIYPLVEIEVEPLEERGNWWDTVISCVPGDNDNQDPLLPWRGMIQWFQQQPELHDSVFINIGSECVTDHQAGSGSGCVFPRLIVGLTKASSIVGMITFVSHS